MKRIVYTITLIACMLILLACGTKGDIKINGEDTIELGFSYEYTATYKNRALSNDEVYWIINNDNVTLCNNVVTPVNGGEVVLTCLLKEDGSVFGQKTLKVINAIVNGIDIYCKNDSIKVGEQIVIDYRIDPEDTTEKVTWVSSDENVATVDDGIVTGINAGTVTITARCSSATDSITFNVIKEITEIELECKNQVSIGSTLYLEFNIDDPVITTESDNIILENNYLYGLTEGVAKIHVTSKSKTNLVNDFDITVTNDNVNDIGATEEEQAIIDGLLESMSLDQKIGQLFFANLSTNEFYIDENNELYVITGGWRDRTPKYISSFLGDRIFGNIYLNYVNTNIDDLTSYTNLIKGYQNLVLNSTGVGALVAIDASELSTYTALRSGFSDYKNNLAIGTTGTLDTAVTYFDVMSSELYEAGINTVLYSAYAESRYIDGVFSKLNSKQIMYSSVAYNELKENNVSLAPYIGSFVYSSSYDKAKNEELIKAAIKDGVGCLAIYGAYEYYNKYSESLFEYIRSLGFKGVLIDCNTTYVSSYIEEDNGYYNAFTYGADMVLASFSIGRWSDNDTNSKIFAAYDYFKDQINQGNYSIDALNEKVSRVLLMKIRNNAIDGTYPSDTFLENNTSKNQSKINNLFNNNTYYIKGDFTGIDKDTQLSVVTDTYTIYDYNERSGTSYNIAAKLFVNKKKLGLAGVTTCVLDIDYVDRLAAINEGDQVLLTIFQKQFSYQVERTETVEFFNEETQEYENRERNYTETIYVDWKDILSIVEEKTTNVVIMIMTDPTYDELFKDYNYPIIYGNYNFDEDFTIAIDVLLNAKTSGVSLYE